MLYDILAPYVTAITEALNDAGWEAPAWRIYYDPDEIDLEDVHAPYVEFVAQDRESGQEFRY